MTWQNKNVWHFVSVYCAVHYELNSTNSLHLFFNTNYQLCHVTNRKPLVIRVLRPVFRAGLAREVWLTFLRTVNGHSAPRSGSINNTRSADLWQPVLWMEFRLYCTAWWCLLHWVEVKVDSLIDHSHNDPRLFGEFSVGCSIPIKLLNWWSTQKWS